MLALSGSSARIVRWMLLFRGNLELPDSQVLVSHRPAPGHVAGDGEIGAEGPGVGHEDRRLRCEGRSLGWDDCWLGPKDSRLGREASFLRRIDWRFGWNGGRWKSLERRRRMDSSFPLRRFPFVATLFISLARRSQSNATVGTWAGAKRLFRHSLAGPLLPSGWRMRSSAL